jgi:hypothetical protein
MKNCFTVPGKNAWLYLICIAALTTLSAVYAGYFPLHRWLYLGAKDYFSCLVALFLGFQLWKAGTLPTAAFWKPLLGLGGFVLLAGYSLLQHVGLQGNAMEWVSSMRIWLYPVLLVWLGYAMAHLDTSNAQERRAGLTRTLGLMAVGSLGIYGLTIAHQLEWCKLYFVVKNICLEGPIPEQWIEPVHTGLVRMAGLFLDPVNNGHFWAWGMALWNLHFRSLPRLVFWLMALVGLGILWLTYSKGALFQFLTILPWVLWNGMPPQFSAKNALRFSRILHGGILAAPLLLIVLIIGLSPYHPGLQNHWEAIQATVNQGTWWGEGAANHGQIAVLSHRLGDHHLGDSAWASIVGQFGWIGLILWGLSWVIFLRHLYEFDSFAALLLYLQWGISLFSEASMYPLSLMGVLVQAGYSLSLMPITYAAPAAPSPQNLKS